MDKFIFYTSTLSMMIQLVRRGNNDAIELTKKLADKEGSLFHCHASFLVDEFSALQINFKHAEISCEK